MEPYVEDLPRVSRDMARFGTAISRSELSPGDLVFFATTSARGVVSHVAIFIGQDSIIHAISDGPNRGVHITSLNARYWRTHFHSAARVLPAAAVPEYGEKIEFAKGIYTGDLKAGEPHGSGFMSLNNGDTYRGGFAEGTFDGTGTYTWKNGESYRGSFRNGELHGRGVFTTASGDSTAGEWKEGVLQTDSATSSGTDTDTASGSGSGSGTGAGQKPDTPETFLEVEDSPWENWDGYITGDFYAWRQQEQESFEQWKKENQPQN